ncbi:hypothetical protein SDC9_152323 [bioreactor metagenome]|uniref:Uncharacterized protein n=1 Tax=bioreactor metagenome TaxID=1076179 RepID=A0A645EX47_9ZZZZ
MRRHGLVLDLQLGQAQLLLDVGQHALTHLGVETNVLAIAQGVAQARRLTHTQRDRARGLDLGQGIVGLGEGCGRSQRGDGHRQQLLLHTNSLWVKRREDWGHGPAVFGRRARALQNDRIRGIALKGDLIRRVFPEVP